MSKKTFAKQQNICKEIIDFLDKEISYLEFYQEMLLLVNLKNEILNASPLDKWTYIKVYENDEEWNNENFLWVFLKNISLYDFSSLIRPGRYICFSGKDKIHRDGFYIWLQSVQSTFSNQVYVYKRYAPNWDDRLDL